RSITLDLKSATGQAIFKELLRSADLVVESFRPGTVDRFGLGYQELSALRPGLVMLSISNFGQSGPYRDYKAVDLIAQAVGGPAMYSQGMQGREPLKYPGNTGQFFAGTTAAVAAMGAVFAARMQGIGQHVDVSIAEALLGSTENKPIEYLYTGQVLTRAANTARWSYLMGSFPCKDGFIGLQGSGRGETWWPRVYRLIGMPELEQDPRFSTPEAREANREAFDVYWYSWLADHTRQEVFEAAQEARFPLAPVYTPRDMAQDPHFRARGFFEEVQQPHAGRLIQPGRPFKMAGTPWRGGEPAPLLGQHNAEVYVGQLGISPRELGRLRAAGVV
ncbi:MAG: CoA transferase, partial [Dehalococcoidia bacterium]